MRLLADSHVLVFWLENPAQLAPSARAAITSGRNQVFFSAASVWELGLKQAKGKLRMPAGWIDLLRADGFSELPLTVAHAEACHDLPLLHGDPFDRVLLAQARAEGAVFVTRDEILHRYGIPTLAA